MGADHMQTGAVQNYLTSDVKTPYFVFISDEAYQPAINALKALGLDIVRMSDFCGGNDKVPNVDALYNCIEEADMNARGNKIAVTGLGEFLGLQGKDRAKHVLLRLKDMNTGGAKVVLLLRGLALMIDDMRCDLRFDGRRHMVVESAACDLSFTLAAPTSGLPALEGFRLLLADMESGRTGNIIMRTAVSLDKSLFTIGLVNTAYEGVRLLARGFVLPQSCGSDAQWAGLLAEMNKHAGSLDAVFDKHGLNENTASAFYAHVSGGDMRAWLYFICLKSKADTLQNGYLRYVLEKTNRSEDLAGNALNAIMDVPHTDRRFAAFYQERKALIAGFPESDIAAFVIPNRRLPAQSIYRLTDVTQAEREEIIAWVSQHGPIPQLGDIYPALAAYIEKYVFQYSQDAKLSAKFTDYFDAYKRQKLSGRLDQAFLEQVDEYAKERPYNNLKTIDDIVDSVDKDGTHLYWLDALGVEYLGLIERYAKKLGLSVRTSIARASLPTITSINRAFYDAWQGSKSSSKALDNVKHGDTDSHSPADGKPPIHLAQELQIIMDVISQAATELKMKRHKRFLIVSDHGASRLAVLRKKEEKYQTDTSGEHSGRCCPVFQPYDLPFATEENGYIILADYGRFQGSRAAIIEVHGGASLEEAVVPIIELSLKDSSITVQLVHEEAAVDHRTGTEVTLFFNTPVQNVSIILNGKRYPGIQVDENHHSVALPDVRKPGTYSADVYMNDDLAGQVTIKAHSKSGHVKDDFDKLFGGI